MTRDPDKNVTLLSESELRSAIARLNASTQAVEDQAHVLAVQQTILDTAKRKRALYGGGPANYARNLQHQKQIQAQQLTLLNEEKENEIRTTLDGASTKIDSAVNTTLISIREKLKRDDANLGQLDQERSDYESSFKAANHSGRQQRMEASLSALRKLDIESLKTQLDIAYLEELHCSHAGHMIAPDDGTETVLHDDLQSLYGEIEDVTTMLVHHEHGKDLLAILSALEQSYQANDSKMLSAAVYKIASLTEQLTQMAERCEQLRSYHIMLETLKMNLAGLSTPTGSFKLPKDGTRSDKNPVAIDPLLRQLDTGGQTIRSIELSIEGQIKALEETIYQSTPERSAQILDLVNYSSADRLRACTNAIADLDKSIVEVRAEVEAHASVPETAAMEREAFVARYNR